MRSMLGKNETYVLETFQSLVKKGEEFDVIKEQMEHLKSDLDNSEDEVHYLKSKLGTKRDIIDDMEIELNGLDSKLKDARKVIGTQEKELETKEKDLIAFEACVTEQVKEINILKDNNYSMVKQISDNVIMEKKIDIQKGVIKEIQDKLKNVEDENARKLSKELDEQKETLEREVDRLSLEVRELEHKNNEKLSLLEDMEKTNAYLKEHLKLEHEKNTLEDVDDTPPLREELRLFDKFRNCDSCGETFGKQSDLESHLGTNRDDEKQSEMNILNRRMQMLETNILEQKSTLFSNLLDLKDVERKYICNCKGHCKIRHTFYNWSKPKSVDLLKRSRINIEEKALVEHETINFQCYSCGNDFSSLGDLEKHSQMMHSDDVLEVCSTNPWGLTFFDV